MIRVVLRPDGECVMGIGTYGEDVAHKTRDRSEYWTWGGIMMFKTVCIHCVRNIEVNKSDPGEALLYVGPLYSNSRPLETIPPSKSRLLTP